MENIVINKIKIYINQGYYIYINNLFEINKDYINFEGFIGATINHNFNIIDITISHEMLKKTTE